MISRLLRRTLVRRVTLALACAFVLVFVVMTSYTIHDQRSDKVAAKTLRTLGPEILQALQSVSQPAAAHALALALDAIFNGWRRTQQVPEPMLIQIGDRHDGQLVFSTPGAGAALLQSPPNEQPWIAPNGVSYRVFQGETPRWSLRLAQPELSGIWLWTRIWPELLKYVAITFAIILLPVWFAVSRGLRPLQRLSDRIATRGSSDLSALSYDPKYEELKPLVHSLDQLMARLRQNVEREHAFVQDAAHELRTPLAVISAQAHVLAMAINGAERHEAEQRMDQAIGRASHLIEQLLALAHVDREPGRDPVRVDVAQLVRQALAQSASAAMAQSIEISLDAVDALPLTLDRYAFESVLDNLLDNAIRYGNEGGRVEVNLKCAQGTLRLSVADDGPGIPAHEHGRVFERFLPWRGNRRHRFRARSGHCRAGRRAAEWRSPSRRGTGRPRLLLYRHDSACRPGKRAAAINGSPAMKTCETSSPRACNNIAMP